MQIFSFNMDIVENVFFSIFYIYTFIINYIVYSICFQNSMNDNKI